MLHIIPPSLPSNVDATAVSNLSNPPPNWSLEADEELVRFLVENCQSHDLSMNGANKYVDSIAVSTVSHNFAAFSRRFLRREKLVSLVSLIFTNRIYKQELMSVVKNTFPHH